MSKEQKREKVKPDARPETVEIGCLSQAHAQVPYWFTAEKGKPATCPGCGRVT